MENEMNEMKEMKEIEINELFKMPIYYNEQKKSIKENIITDLELVKTVDSSLNSIYYYLFNNSNTFSNKFIKSF